MSAKLATISSILLSVAIAAVVSLAACGGSGANALRDTAWELTSLNGSDLLPGTAIRIEFAADQVSGFAGCNTYGGSYKTTGDSLTLVDLYATEMGCLEPAGILEQESAYLTALRSAARYQIDGRRLEILDETGAEILVYITLSSNPE
ncbi:MAG TPA: META domain-containing protein [Anaerolineae bacterium]|nr:META domain-containing protein [Anaerolineae bacterium]